VTKKKVAVDTSTGKETVLEEKTATDKKEVAEPAPVDDKAAKKDDKKDDKKADKKKDDKKKDEKKSDAPPKPTTKATKKDDKK